MAHLFSILPNHKNSDTMCSTSSDLSSSFFDEEFDRLTNESTSVDSVGYEDRLPIVDYDNLSSAYWECSECHFPMPPVHARICIRCVSTEAAENSAAGLHILDYGLAERELVCAHCVIESAHRFHITRLYMPIKLQQVSAEKLEELSSVAIKRAADREEANLLKRILNELAIKYASINSLDDQHTAWRNVENVIDAIVSTNQCIQNQEKIVESAVREMERQRCSKQNLFETLNSLTRKSNEVPKLKRRRTRSLNRQDFENTHPGFSLKRCGAISDLSVIGRE